MCQIYPESLNELFDLVISTLLMFTLGVYKNIYKLSDRFSAGEVSDRTHTDGLHTAPEKSFQNSLSTGTRWHCTRVCNSSRHSASVWAELTPRTASAHTLAQIRPTSAVRAWLFPEILAWHRATCFRQRSTYGPLSPRRCCSPSSWHSKDSRGASSWAGSMAGYLEARAAVTCSLESQKITKALKQYESFRYRYSDPNNNKSLIIMTTFMKNGSAYRRIHKSFQTYKQSEIRLTKVSCRSHCDAAEGDP